MATAGSPPQQPPSLFGGNSPPTLAGRTLAGRAGNPVVATHEARNLLDLLYDGFYMVFLLRNRYAPTDADAFRERIRSFLTGFERGTKRVDASAEDVYLAKFAFCALIDEVVLTSRLKLRDVWERRPLQLEFFGEQLAGERFFDHLEKLRQGGASKLQVLEVFHMCLLLGFQGKYILEGSEKLNYLTARLGDEIAHLKGKRAPFAPHWAAPDRTAHTLRGEIPLWVIASVFALVALLAFLGLRSVLNRQTESDLQAYSGVVKLAPQPAHITITLP
jgi:type VI secretion system protein ImpK